jgi:hypothetical protein
MTTGTVALLYGACVASSALLVLLCALYVACTRRKE